MARMLAMLRDLVGHKWHANAALLTAIGRDEAAVSDPAVTNLLHHILIANRFWLLTTLGVPFVLDDESRPADSFASLVQRFARTEADESAWLDTATDAALERVLEGPLIPHGQCSVSQAFMQVCLHSHGHRVECAKLLRRHGGTPPQTDFILWLSKRPTAEWPADTGAGADPA
jgi:uncharacterized damage-inducible protein DinB